MLLWALTPPYAEWKVGIQGLVALTPSDYSLGHFRDKNCQFQDECKNNSTWQDNAQNLSPNMKQTAVSEALEAERTALPASKSS